MALGMFAHRSCLILRKPMRSGSFFLSAVNLNKLSGQVSVFQYQQFFAIDHIAVHDEDGDAASVPDVQCGVAVDN